MVWLVLHMVQTVQRVSARADRMQGDGFQRLGSKGPGPPRMSSRRCWTMEDRRSGITKLGGLRANRRAGARNLAKSPANDQLDVSNLTSAELLARAIQRIEEKHKWKLASSEGALFLGTRSGARAVSIVSPKLTEWIGTEMQKEKDRRQRIKP